MIEYLRFLFRGFLPLKRRTGQRFSCVIIDGKVTDRIDFAFNPDDEEAISQAINERP
jgi:hypothetical protein